MIYKTDFESTLPDDCKQYREIAKRYLDLKEGDGQTAFELFKDSWALAQRWADLQASARKVRDLSKEDFNLTDFKTFCYARYRQLHLMHESTRMIWSKAAEDIKWCERNNVNPDNMKRKTNEAT